MLRLLIDQDFNHDILRGLYLRLPDLDAITVLQIGLDQVPDPDLLDWAASQDRIVITHGVNTMPHHAYQRIRKAEPVAGVFIVPQELPIGQAIAELEILAVCSLEREWDHPTLIPPRSACH